jgi:hypothetical protein
MQMYATERDVSTSRSTSRSGSIHTDTQTYVSQIERLFVVYCTQERVLVHSFQRQTHIHFREIE